MKKILDIAANKYFAVENETWKQVQRDCSCDNPGKDLQCIDCPCYLEVRKKVFSILHREKFEDCPPPIFYKEEQEAYRSFDDIVKKPNLKAEALKLYEDTRDIPYISSALNIEEDVVLIWVELTEENEAFYSDYFRNLCVEIIKKHSKSNLPVHLWARVAGISNNTLQNWVKNISEGKKLKSKKSDAKQLVLKRWEELHLEPQQKLEIIAEELGVQVAVVKKYIYALNIKLSDFFIEEETIKKCIELYHKHSKSITSRRDSVYSRISKELGISYSSAYRYVQKDKTLKSVN